MKSTATGMPDRDTARYGVAGLMAVQAFVGYEWFLSLIHI